MVADGRLSLSERQEYDIRNDQALPNLQAAINQARTNRHRALRLRETCLARIAFSTASRPSASAGEEAISS